MFGESNKEMKILWLCNLVLPDFSQEFGIKRSNFGGWMTAMLHELEKKEGIDISLCFPIYDKNRLKDGNCNGHDYYTFLDNAIAETYDLGMIKVFEKMLEKADPSIVHIWGTEYPHTTAMLWACKNEEILGKAVVDIQGLVSIIAKHYLTGIPEEYRNLKGTDAESMEKGRLMFERHGKCEIESIKMVNHVMGRTDWDRACVEAVNPDVNYYTCDRILRSKFYDYAGKWNYKECREHSIFVSQASYPVKGFHYLLQALPIVIKKYPDTHVYVSGKDIFNVEEKDPYTVYLEKLIDQFNLSECISFTGLFDEEQMIQQYLESNVFISASLIENSPNSLSEAMILGVPCISSYVGGVYNKMTHDVDGFLYPHDEPDLLAYYIGKIFQNKDNLCEKFSNNSVHKMLEIANPKRNVDSLMQIYKEINSRSMI